LALTSTAERGSNDVVIRWEVRRVVGLSTEGVHVFALLSVWDVTWHRCDLSVAFADLASGEGHGRGGDGCRMNGWSFGVDICPHKCGGTVRVNSKSTCYEWQDDLRDRCKLLHHGCVRVFDTKNIAEVLSESAVVDEIVVLILEANIFLALEESAEPAQNDIG
jgi:hypothetical protein